MRKALVLICAAILLIAFSSPVMAEHVKMKDNPKSKGWHSMVGEWSADVEFRETASGAWQKGSAEVTLEWILEGTVVKTSGRNHKGVSFVDLTTYDPRLKTHIFSGFDSMGGHVVGTSGDWDGTSYTGNWTSTTPDGETIPGRCSFNFSSDFASAAIECQLFTEGKWWTNRKTKSSKK